ncbi:MAG: hypothetical protein MJE68_14345 [Proteobacteria bacterium]|nr:hypothetical protein [Pseudomonadota bacterium]
MAKRCRATVDLIQSRHDALKGSISVVHSGLGGGSRATLQSAKDGVPD